MKIAVSVKHSGGVNLAAAERAVIGAINQAALMVQSSAITRVPSDTGALRQSIRANPARSNGGKVSASVSTNLEYAPYVEFGTGARGASTNQNTKVKVSYKSDWAGQRAQPFLYPALRQNRARAKNLITEAIRKANK